MKKHMCLFAVILLSALCSVGCSSKADDDYESGIETASLIGTFWTGTITNRQANVSFTEKTVEIEFLYANHILLKGTYLYEAPNIYFNAADDSWTVSATGVVTKSIMKLSVTFKNQFGDIKYFNETLIKD
ncbi:MAG: hypothetical protein IJR01_03930 [Bacteroidales bacterium]|nr:hypothetical protein [Bacteroidales bacterium]